MSRSAWLLGYAEQDGLKPESWHGLSSEPRGMKACPQLPSHVFHGGGTAAVGDGHLLAEMVADPVWDGILRDRAQPINGYSE